MLEVLHFHCTQHQTEELAVRPVELAHEMNGPGSGGTITYRLAHERRQPCIGFKCFEKVSIGNIDARKWPEAGKIEKFALRVDQRDRADMRPTADPLFQHQMGLITGH